MLMLSAGSSSGMAQPSEPNRTTTRSKRNTWWTVVWKGSTAWALAALLETVQTEQALYNREYLRKTVTYTLAEQREDK